MEGSNLLSGGVETLNEIKEQLLELQSYQGTLNNLLQEEEKLEKVIQDIEKTRSDEITSTVKKRRQEIEGTYDEQMTKTKARIRKIKEKRDKRKSHKMSERMKEETASIREENSHLKLEAKTLIRKNKVPAFCNTKLYYALYFPKHLEDLLIILCTLLLTLFLIPCGIYFGLLPDKILYLIFVYIATVIVFGGIYLFIGNHTKDKHSDVLKQVGGLWTTRRVNHKRMKAIKKSIRKDRDESSYGLENFDQELSKLDQEEADIAGQKKEALTVFDNTTSQLLAGEIKSRYEEKLTALTSEYNKAMEEVTSAQNKIKALTIKIANEYEPFIGKDLMKVDRLETLTNIIMAGNATTISEAVAFHKQNVN